MTRKEALRCTGLCLAGIFFMFLGLACGMFFIGCTGVHVNGNGEVLGIIALLAAVPLCFGFGIWLISRARRPG